LNLPFVLEFGVAVSGVFGKEKSPKNSTSNSKDEGSSNVQYSIRLIPTSSPALFPPHADLNIGIWCFICHLPLVLGTFRLFPEENRNGEFSMANGN
jgi:hypothetical protein